MSEPSKEVIDKIKAQFPDRALRLVELVDAESGSDGESIFFVMTGPNRDEYKKFVDEMLSAKDAKGDSERNERLTAAVEKAALAMIRWPDRAEVVELFRNRPALSSAFPKELHASAGANFEVRSKKL